MFRLRHSGTNGSPGSGKTEIDRLVGILVRACSAKNDADEGGPSAFLHQRVRARIEAEQRQRASEVQAWGVLFLQGLYVLPILTLLAIVVTGVALTTPGHGALVNGHTPTSSAVPAIALNEIAPFSNDELMAAATGGDDRGK